MYLAKSVCPWRKYMKEGTLRVTASDNQFMVGQFKKMCNFIF